MGTTATIEEIVSVHKHNQLRRLRQSKAGIQLLQSIGYDSQATVHDYCKIEPIDRQQLKIAPIPGNMDGTRHAERRAIRAKYFNKKPEREPQQMHVYTDAAGKGTSWAVAYWTVLNRSYTEGNKQFNSAEEAELYAIGKAVIHLSQPARPLNIYTDNKRACRLLDSGHISRSAAHLFKHIQGTVKLYWIPGHAGVLGNEKANQLARDAYIRAPSNGCQSPTSQEPTHPQLHLKEYKTAKRLLPAPHPNLTRQQQTLFRQAQAGTLETPARLHLIRYGKTTPLPSCSQCKITNTQDHILWQCPQYIQIRKQYTREWLTSPRREEEQRGLIDFIQEAVSRSLDRGL